ncbi:MAG: ABC transporter permease [Myxococcales bacterium]|nr:ABC transporter permease [Myxococcales bacterium]
MIGIVLGVSSFVVFLGLGEGLRENVLERVYVVDQVEVEPLRHNLGSISMSGSLFGRGTGLDDYTVEDILALPGVAAVYPKVRLSFPALLSGGGDLVGQTIQTEFLAEGMPEGLMASELPPPETPDLAFTDWDRDLDGEPFTCQAAPDAGLGFDVGCPPGRFCNAEGVCERVSCIPVDEVLATPSRAEALAAQRAIADAFGRRRVVVDVRELDEEFRREGWSAEYRVAISPEFGDDYVRPLPWALALRGARERVGQSANLGRTRVRAAAGQINSAVQAGREPNTPAVITRFSNQAIDLSYPPPPQMYSQDERECVDSPSYCTTDTRVCEMPIPAVASPFLLELINSSVATAMSGGDRSIPGVTEATLLGLTVDVRFGRGFLGSARQLEEQGRMSRRARLVGWSWRSMRIGSTIPLTYVQRLNSAYVGEETEGQYHALLVVAESSDRLAGVVQLLEDDIGVAIGSEYQQAKRGSLLITLLTVGLMFISALIIMLAALNITHTFLMVVAERRKEIGVLRAVGAQRRHIMGLILSEAAIIGIAGATFGFGLSFLGAELADRLLECRVPDWAWVQQWCIPDFPFKPNSFFAFKPWILWAGAGVALIFSLLGAALPAYRASRVDPAEALRSGD